VAVHRPDGVGAFEFVILSTLRAAQLMRGCIPKVERGHKATTTAQCEVAAGKVMNTHDYSVLEPIAPSQPPIFVPA
jgi:hypothetical protein